jgi:hypothetical protein
VVNVLEGGHCTYTVHTDVHTTQLYTLLNCTHSTVHTVLSSYLGLCRLFLRHLRHRLPLPSPLLPLVVVCGIAVIAVIAVIAGRNQKKSVWRNLHTEYRLNID